MKKLCVIFVTLIFAFALSLNALAASGYSKLASFGVIYAQGVYFADKYGSFYVLDADKDSSLLYTSMISYDDLSGICSEVNASGVNCTLHKNIESGYWVIAVNDPVIFNSVVGLIGNTDGYVYVAEIDTTGEDSVDLLSQILTRLILVESYVKSTYFELWEQGGVLDDIYDVIDSIDGYVYDIKDRLYYNGKSAAYYLYKIESHLATIANNFGSSDGSSSDGSSSGTDLSGITTKLDTLTGLIGTIQLRADTLTSQLESTNTYLSAVSTKLDDVATIATDLNSVQKYVFWISSDVEDALEELETATGLIGSTSLDVDALVTGMGVTQDLIATVNTNLTTMINKQELTFDYLADLSGDLGTVISKQNSALSELETMSESLDTIVKRLSYSDTGIGYYAYRINNFLRNELIEKLDSVIALLQEEGAFTTDISGVLTDLEMMIENQNSVLALLQEDGAFTTDIINALSYDGVTVAQHVRDFSLTAYLNMSFMIDHLSEMSYELSVVNQSLSSYLANKNSPLLTKLDTMLQNQQNVVDALSADGYIGDELHDIAVDTHLIYIKLGAFQEQQNTLVDQISKSLTHNNFSIAYYVWFLGGLVERSFESVLANQSTALPVLQSMSESLSTIKDRLYYVDASVSYYVSAVNKKLGEHLPIIIANQEAGLEQQSALSELVSNIDASLNYGNYGIGYRLYTMNNKFTTMVENQQKLIDLIEDLELTTNVTIENIENITIDVTNKAYEVFYITDSEGNEQNLADFSGDVLTISGRLLNFFFKVAFDDALDSVDSALNDMTEFYIDDSVLVGGGSLWE